MDNIMWVVIAAVVAIALAGIVIFIGSGGLGSFQNQTEGIQDDNLDDWSNNGDQSDSNGEINQGTEIDGNPEDVQGNNEEENLIETEGPIISSLHSSTLTGASAAKNNAEKLFVSKTKGVQQSSYSGLEDYANSNCGDNSFHIESAKDSASTYPLILKGCFNNEEAENGPLDTFVLSHRYEDTQSSSLGETIPNPAAVESDSTRDKIYCDEAKGFRECGSLTTEIASYQVEENLYSFFMLVKSGKIPNPDASLPDLQSVTVETRVWAVNRSGRTGGSIATGNPGHTNPSSTFYIGDRCKQNNGDSVYNGNMPCIDESSFGVAMQTIEAGETDNRNWLETCLDRSEEVNQATSLDHKPGSSTETDGTIKSLGHRVCTYYFASKCVGSDSSEISCGDNMPSLCQDYGMGWDNNEKSCKVSP